MEQTENQTPNQGAESTNQTTSTGESTDNLLMGILSYLGPLLLIPYLTVKDDAFVKYHLKQGIVLFGLEILIYIIGSIMMYGHYFGLIGLLNLGTLILTIIGIVNVVQKKEVPLPLIGQFADKVKI